MTTTTTLKSAQQPTSFWPTSTSGAGAAALSNLSQMSPLEKLASLRQDMDRLWELTFSGRAGATFGNLGQTAQNIQWCPAVDLYDESERLVVKVELPGMTREQIQINYQDGVLSISGERKSDYEHGKEPDAYRSERAVGKFARDLALPVPIEADQINATYKDGVLAVLLPKSEDAKPHKVEVKIA